MNELNILYVEDDIEVVQDTIFLLGDSFKSITTALDGDSALELYYENKPDIILLDINLPLLNGLEVAKKIRETDEETIIIIISAYSDKDKLMSAINLGVSGYIKKPFSVNEIKETIDKLIQKQRSRVSIDLGAGFQWNKQLQNLYYKNEIVQLTKKEISLIALLCGNQHIFLNSEEITKEIFLDDNSISNNATQLISRFKKKILKSLNLEADAFFIENIYGAGYRIKILNSL